MLSIFLLVSLSKDLSVLLMFAKKRFCFLVFLFFFFSILLSSALTLLFPFKSGFRLNLLFFLKISSAELMLFLYFLLSNAYIYLKVCLLICRYLGLFRCLSDTDFYFNSIVTWALNLCDCLLRVFMAKNIVLSYKHSMWDRGIRCMYYTVICVLYSINVN